MRQRRQCVRLCECNGTWTQQPTKAKMDKQFAFREAEEQRVLVRRNVFVPLSLFQIFVGDMDRRKCEKKNSTKNTSIGYSSWFWRGDHEKFSWRKALSKLEVSQRVMRIDKVRKEAELIYTFRLYHNVHWAVEVIYCIIRRTRHFHFKP